MARLFLPEPFACVQPAGPLTWRGPVLLSGSPSGRFTSVEPNDVSTVADDLMTATQAGDAEGAEPRFLIVDDVLVERLFVSKLVERATGMKTTLADDGESALVSIEAERPVAVLTDLQMKRMNGLELVEHVRKRFPSVPVILMTAYGSEDLAFLALKAGATSYVPKRALAKELGATLNQILAATAAGRLKQRTLGSLEERFSRFRLQNDADLIAPLVDALRDDLCAVGFGDHSTRLRMTVALQEALANAIFHGNLEVSSDLRQDDERAFYDLAKTRRDLPPYRDRRVHVESWISPTAVSFTVRDEGPGFDTAVARREVDPEDLLRIGGRGLLLIRTFMDEVQHNERGNSVTIIKKLARDVAAAPAG